MVSDKPSIDSIFLAAVERQPEERSAYLDEVCGKDAELRARVERLLSAQSKVSGFLEAPAPELGATELRPVTEQPGDQIGPYKLREQIGEGGMGVVYVAEQIQPVKRKVALKVIKPGMDTRQVIARFEAERQALAIMDHPNIAKVLEAGSTESGRPYFVMDLIRGVPITEYCDNHKLTTDQRLKLFAVVCQAVQHAHQKGIIHRDIKPGNILVTRNGDRAVPKIIDFGVAKAVNQRLTKQTIYTHFAEMIGTPLYMSPEQAEMSELDIDTRTDVYSLGVVLYELLTGGTPIEKGSNEQLSYDEMRRIIREDEPPRPSDRVSTLSAAARTTAASNRSTEPKKLNDLLRGDLDWIVMKALEKDRARRYETASNFATDVNRYLNDEPIEARPPSVAYQVGKFMHRHKHSVVMAASLLVLLLAGIVGTTTGMIRANHAEAEARHDAVLEAKARAQAGRERLRAETMLARMQLERGVRRLNGQDPRGLLNLVDAWLTADEIPALQSAIGRLWAVAQDAIAGRLVRILPGGGSRLAYSPDKNLMAVVNGTSVQMWDLATYRPLGPSLAFDRLISAVLFSPNGRLLAVHSINGQSRLWNTQTQQPVGPVLQHDLAEHEQPIDNKWGEWAEWSAAFSHDGSLLATGTADGGLRLWDATTGQPSGELRGHRGVVRSVAFSPDGKWLASGSEDGTARLWDLATRRLHVPPFQAPFIDGLPDGYQSAIGKVTFSPDGKLLAVMCTDGTAGLWEAQSGRLHRLLKDPTTNWMLDIVFSPDGKILAAGLADWTVKMWDVSSGEILGKPMLHRDCVSTIAFSPDGKRLASGSRDHTARLWSVATGAPLGPPMVDSDQISRVVFSSTGKLLVSSQRYTRVWKVDQQPDAPAIEEIVLTTSFTSLNGRYRATLHRDHAAIRRVELLDTTTGSTVTDSFRHGGVTTVAFSPDAKLLATGSTAHAHLVKIWEVTTGRLRQTLKCPSRTYRIAFSPDERTLAVSLLNGTVQLWDFAAGQRLGLPLQHGTNVWDVAFSPDGKLLASISEDQERWKFWIWDVTTGPNYLGVVLPHVMVGSPSELSSFSTGGTVRMSVPEKAAERWHLPAAPNDFHEMRLRSWVAMGLQQDLQGQLIGLSANEWNAMYEELSALQQTGSIPANESQQGP